MAGIDGESGIPVISQWTQSYLYFPIHLCFTYQFSWNLLFTFYCSCTITTTTKIKIKKKNNTVLSSEILKHSKPHSTVQFVSNVNYLEVVLLYRLHSQEDRQWRMKSKNLTLYMSLIFAIRWCWISICKYITDPVSAQDYTKSKHHVWDMTKCYVWGMSKCFLNGLVLWSLPQGAWSSAHHPLMQNLFLTLSSTLPSHSSVLSVKFHYDW